MANQGGGNLFNFGGNGTGKGNDDHGGNGGFGDAEYKFEGGDEHEHEHEYANIVQTPSLSAFEELVHQVITLEFHDRGLSLDLSYEEAEELGQVLAGIVSYLNQKRTLEP